MSAPPSSSRRYLALWFPSLPTDWREAALCRSGAAPAEILVVAGPVRGAMRLSAVSRGARRLGLKPGLTLADARARCPRLVVEADDPAADAVWLGRLAEACGRWTPLVAPDGPDGLVLDVTGAVHLFGGEEALRAGIAARLDRSGFAARAALAGTPDAARALARFGPAATVPPGGEAQALRPLPVAALEPDPETRAALSLAGLARIGDLADLPGAPLAARFGTGLTVRLARVLGREDRRITPLRPEPACRVDEAFAEPILHAGAIRRAVERLVDEAGRRLAARGRGGRAFVFRFFRTDGAVRSLTVETARPTRDARTILRLLDARLDALADPLDPGFGFDLLRLDVPVAERLDPAQADLDGGDDTARAEAQAVCDLVDRLVARLGPARVLRFAAHDSHDPVEASRLVPAPGRPPLGHSGRAGQTGRGWPDPARPRPFQLFDPPQPVEAVAEAPDGPPLGFRWRRSAHRIVQAEGPERIAPEWWRGPARPTRDYYRVEDGEGGRFWLFRERPADGAAPPRWFLHGLFA